MRSVLAAELLTAWEVGLTRHPIQRALILLALAWPDTPGAEFASLSIGQRDAALLTLREQLFGARLNSVASCPHCHDRLELTFNVDEVRAPMTTQLEQVLHLQVDEYDVHFRPPNSTDLLAIADVRDAVAARQRLLQRCLLTVQQMTAGGRQVDITEQIRQTMPATLVEKILTTMAQADPQGDVQLALVCPNCQHAWMMTFDILTYLWNEINDWAQRTLREVHLLATAYGWREADILALSVQRRHFYLALIGK